MSTSVGAITLSLTIDAANVTASVQRAVAPAMRQMVSTVSSGVASANRELGNINSRVFANLSREATTAGTTISRSMSTAMAEAARSTAAVESSMRRTQTQAAATSTALGNLGRSGSSAMSSVTRSAEESGGALGKLGGIIGITAGQVKTLGITVAGIAGLKGIGDVLSSGLERLTAIDDAKAKLTGLGNSAETVQQIMTDALKSVQGTAFGLGDAATVAASAVAAGVQPGKDLERTLKLVADTAAIAGTDLGSMGAIFNQVATTGKVQGDVLAQLGDRGIPIIQLLAKEMGVTAEETVDLASKGKINFAIFENAIEKGMGGAALAMGNTFSGAVRNVHAAISRLGAAFLDAPFKAAPHMLANITGAIDKLTTGVNGVNSVLFQGKFSEKLTEAFNIKPDSAFVTSLISVHDWFAKLGSDSDGLRSKITDALGFGKLRDIFTEVWHLITQLVGPLSDIGTSLASASAAIGVSIWGALLNVIKELVPILGGLLVPILDTIAGFMREHPALIQAVVVGYTAYRTAMLASTAATWLMSTAATATSGAMTGLGAALQFITGNWIVLAIAAVVAVLYLFFTKTETGRKVFADLKKWAVEAWNAIVDAARKAWDWLQPILTEVWRFITETLAPAFVHFWQDYVKPAFEGIAAVITWWWNNIISPYFGFVVDIITNVIAPVVLWLWNNVISPAFQGMAAVITWWWTNVIQPTFNFVSAVISNVIAPAISWLWNNVVQPAFSGMGDIISAWWGIISGIFGAVVDYVTGTLWPNLQALWADVQEAWNSWAALFSWWWSNVIQPTFALVVDIIQNVVAPAITWLWNNIVAPAFQGIGDIISWVWDNVISPTFDLISSGVHVLADAFSWIWDNIISPIWNNVGSLIRSIWENVISPAWDAMKSGLQAVGDFFSSIVTGIGNVWSGLKSLLAKPINFMIGTVYNNGIRKAWNVIEKFIPGIDAAPEIGLIPEAHTGGRINGPKGRDNVLMWGEHDEHMLTVSDVVKAGGHNVVYAIRDMIQRGIPFSWDNGQLINQLGRDNLSRYGAAVQAAGIQSDKVNPEGLFDSLLPKFYRGGAVTDEPWVQQLIAGHVFAAAQNGKPYQWGGPTGPGSSFDCSGYMGSTAAAILGLNPWQRYWSTASFAGYPNVGPMGFVKGTDAGFTIGVTDDPGGPGGGHTAGVLGAAGTYLVARVESGGALGNVHYGSGTDVMNFAAQYHLPIGANGFFDAGAGGGPNPDSQRGFLRDRIRAAFDTVLNPIKESITATIGAPPPQWLAIPPKFLDHGRDTAVNFSTGLVDGLTDGLGTAWHKALDVGKTVMDYVTPFDSGGVAHGTGLMAKNVIEPERILSAEQTRLFDALVTSLQQIAGQPNTASPVLLTGTEFATGIANLIDTLNSTAKQTVDATTSAALAQTTDAVSPMSPQIQTVQSAVDEVGRIVTSLSEFVQRSATSSDLEAGTRAAQIQAGFDSLASMLTDNALIPIMESAVSAGVDFLKKLISGGVDEITKSTDSTTAAVYATADTGGDGGSTTTAAFGSPGSSFDAVQAISDAVVSVAQTAQQAFTQVANSIAQAALAQTPSKANPSKGKLGTDISGGTLVDTIVRLTGVEIDLRDTAVDTLKEITEFRGDLRAAFDESGRIVTDTAELMQRNESNRDLVISEMERINRELIKAVLKYLILNVLLPIIQAILGAMITLVSTAIGAAIGSVIPIIGTAIGAAIGAAIGTVLAGLAAVFTSALAVGAGAALNSFDSGGVASGVGLLSKAIIEPERMLSPRQTESFDRLVGILDKADLGRRNTTINAPFTVVGGANAGRTVQNDLLSLLNG